MIFKYNSRKLNETLIFSMPDNGGYVRLDDRQICEGGNFRGATISATPSSFEKECKKWARQYISKIYSF